MPNPSTRWQRTIVGIVSSACARNRLARELARRGASLIEVGFPYSDPIADGSVVQASYTRALARGLRLDDVFACARRLTDSPELTAAGVPLIAMASYSLVYRRGPEHFVRRAQEAGFRQAVRERDDPFGDYGSRPR